MSSMKEEIDKHIVGYSFAVNREMIENSPIDLTDIYKERYAHEFGEFVNKHYEWNKIPNATDSTQDTYSLSLVVFERVEFVDFLSTFLSDYADFVTERKNNERQ